VRLDDGSAMYRAMSPRKPANRYLLSRLRKHRSINFPDRDVYSGYFISCVQATSREREREREREEECLTVSAAPPL